MEQPAREDAAAQRLAAGGLTVAAGGTLKALIPPSLMMIRYSVVASTFIFDLFVAAIVPLLLTLFPDLSSLPFKLSARRGSSEETARFEQAIERRRGAGGGPNGGICAFQRRPRRR